MIADVRLTGSNGDMLTLTHSNAGTYQLLDGLSGFGAPEPQHAVHPSPDGAVVMGSRDRERSMNFTVRVFASGTDAIVAAKRRLEAAVRYRKNSLARLTMSTQWGDFWLPVVRRLGDGQTITWDSLNDVWGDLVLPLFSPQAHWESVDPVNLPVLRQVAGETLLPELALMQLSSASAAGVMSVSNPGDVDSPVVWKIHGPVGSVTFTRDDGQSFTLEGVAADELITVSTRWGDVPVTDETGANRYELVAQGPRLFYLPDGASQVEVSATGVDEESFITGYYYPRLAGVL